MVSLFHTAGSWDERKNGKREKQTGRTMKKASDRNNKGGVRRSLSVSLVPNHREPGIVYRVVKQQEQVK